MILLIDAGNSLITIGLHDGSRVVKTFTMETKKIRTRDEFALYLQNILQMNHFDSTDIVGAAVASVVPAVNRALVEALEEYFDIHPVMVEPGIRTGIHLNVDNPKEVGSDLIADGIAGHVKYPGTLLIINCGTATKFSVISAKGEFIGVAIAPGFEIGSEGLFQKTAQLPNVGMRIPKDPIGKNSVDAITSGLFYSYAGSIQSYIALIKSRYGQETKVILTGGVSGLFADYLKPVVDYVDPNLTLEGLKIIYDKNRDERT